MRKLAYAALLLVTVTVQTGCFIPLFASSPDERVRQMIYASESMRHVPRIWERIWGFDMPDVATPYRTHGGVI